jgi:putative tryptophan/tyrosine transport system substrate-binding protein
MKRREFITLLGGAAAWPLVARAQRSVKVYRVGYLSAGSPGDPFLFVFTDALRELDWIEGKTIIIEPLYAEDRIDRLPQLAAELVQRNVDVIVAVGTLAALAAKRATTTIPIVMALAGDPLGSGLVVSLAHPGGNVTGLSMMAPDLAGKSLQMLRELVPSVSRVAVLWNAANPYPALVFKQTQIASLDLGIQIQSLEVRGPNDFDRAFEAAIQQRAEALVTVGDPLTVDYRKQITEFANKSRLPAIYATKDFVAVGGLMSYGAQIHDLFPRVAKYVDKILKGEKPADMPVEQPTKFELVINLKTAKAFGITVPPSLLARADEVIE